MCLFILPKIFIGPTRFAVNRSSFFRYLHESNRNIGDNGGDKGSLWCKNNMNYEVKKLLRIVQNAIRLHQDSDACSNEIKGKAKTSKLDTLSLPKDLNDLINRKDSLEVIKNEILLLEENQDITNILQRAQKLGIPMYPPPLVTASKLKASNLPVQPRKPFNTYRRLLTYFYLDIYILISLC